MKAPFTVLRSKSGLGNLGAVILDGDGLQVCIVPFANDAAINNARADTICAALNLGTGSFDSQVSAMAEWLSLRGDALTSTEMDNGRASAVHQLEEIATKLRLLAYQSLQRPQDYGVTA